MFLQCRVVVLYLFFSVCTSNHIDVKPHVPTTNKSNDYLSFVSQQGIDQLRNDLLTYGYGGSASNQSSLPSEVINNVDIVATSSNPIVDDQDTIDKFINADNMPAEAMLTDQDIESGQIIGDKDDRASDDYDDDEQDEIGEKYDSETANLHTKKNKTNNHTSLGDLLYTELYNYMNQYDNKLIKIKYGAFAFLPVENIHTNGSGITYCNDCDFVE